MNGKVKVQVDILPVEQADKNPVGKARDNPNHSPTLPQPEGRLELSLNPFKMFSQMMSDDIKRKIYLACCAAVCCALCIALAPIVLGGVVSQWVSNIL